MFQQGVSPTGGYTQATNGLAPLHDQPGGFQFETEAVSRIGQSGGTGQMRVLLSCDLSEIPAGWVINSASLTMTAASIEISGVPVTEVGPIELHEITGADFVPSEVRWSERSSGVSWTPGGETRGGAFDATVLSSVPGVSSAPSTQVFSSSQDFVDTAQSALDGDGTLQLILLAPVTEFTFTGSGSATLRFHSNDSGSPTVRPLLTIDAVGVGQPPATDFTWGLPSLGDWNDNASWSPSNGAPPNNANHTATFGNAIQGNSTVVVDSPVTVNRINFDNTLSYAIAGLGSVNLAANTEMPSVPPAIDVQSGSHQFQAIANLLDSTTVNVASGSTLEFNNRLFLNGHTLTKTGEGTLAISNDVVLAGGSIDLQQGTIAGNGTVGGDFVNDGGTISPGNSNVQANSVVPEPATWLLLGVGLLMTAFCGIRKKRFSNGQA